MTANTSRAAIALDAAPSAQDLRAASAAGMTYVAWRAAGRPVAAKSATPSPLTRPWFPYRSKWEQSYAEHLESLTRAGFLRAWEYEPERLVIGVGAKYTPDFRVTKCDGSVEWREVKGFRREAAIVRIKAAALRYPDQRFVLVTKRNGQWEYTTIGAKP